MREVGIKVYQYSELSDHAKDTALETFKLCMNGWANDDILEIFRERLDNAGFPTDNIEFSLSYWQGDGMAFYGKIESEGLEKIAGFVLDFNELRIFEKLKEDISVNIVRNHWANHYSHYNTMSVEVEWEGYDDIQENYHMSEDALEKFIDVFQSKIEKYVRNTSQELEKLGYKILEDMYSDENVIAGIEANDWEFTEDGNRWTGA